MRMHLDYETRSTVDLKTYGLERYARDCEIILASWAFEDGSTHQWDGLDLDNSAPGTLIEAFRDSSVEIHAFNAPFERKVTSHQLGIDIPIERWHCTMAHAYSRGFSGGLAQVGEQMGIPEEVAKLREGRSLISRFCTPRRESLANRQLYWLPEDDPEAWNLFRRYNHQDVEAERWIYRFLQQFPVTPEERALWILDQEINDRGLPVDIALAEHAQDFDEILRDKSLGTLETLTWLANPNSRDQLLDWLRRAGTPLPDLQKATVADYLQRGLGGEVDEVLRLRQQLASTACKKFTAVGNQQVDGRMRGCFQFCGASRTGRWGGRGLQPQNLPRPTIPNPEVAADTVAADHLELFEACYDNPLEALGSCVRSVIAAPPGQRLVVADLSSIESRVLGWLTGCKRINETFAAGKDTYQVFAQDWLKVPYDQVTKTQRNLSKPPDLGCGYGLGASGLVKYADNMGVKLSEKQALHAVQVYRTTRHEVPAFWRMLDHWAVEALAGTPNRMMEIAGDFLLIHLPSGRNLHYYKPEMRDGSLTYLGQNSFTHKWERLHTWGGKLVENIVQAIARDILAEGMKLFALSPGYEITGHVHDEIIALAHAKEAEHALRHLERCMSTTPPWAPGLLLAAHGYTAKRYRKD